jgi:transaldolase/glucose-6-phosphate isomerase
MAALDRLGVSLDDITDKLTADGVRLFCDADDKLLGAIACKRATALAGGLDREKRSARSVARNRRQNAG